MRVFDLHCDTLTVCFSNQEQLLNDSMSVSLKYVRRDFCWCQTFAVYVPDSLRGMDAVRYFDAHYRFFGEQMRSYSAFVAQVKNVCEIDEVLQSGRCAAILSIEGGSAIGPDLSRVRALAEMGVKLIGLTWNAENELGGGFDYEGGLKPFGVEAVAEMERCGIVVDVSHLNDRGFEDMLQIARRPFIASHSNARSICNHPRNLNDAQIKELIRRRGLLGLNFYERFLSENGPGAIKELLEHIHHILALGGEDILALGADFDGAQVHEEIGGPHKLSFLYRELLKSGLPKAIIEKIFFSNARAFFERYEAANADF